MEDLSKELGELIEQTKVYYKSYQQAKAREDMKRDELRQYMLLTGLKSARTDVLTASIVSKPAIEIRHEQSALDWLKQESDLELDQFIGLKATPFKKLAMHKLKESGEQIPGIEVTVNETLSIRLKEKNNE